MLGVVHLNPSTDKFLFQLRAFQDVRGKVLNPDKVDRSLHMIGVEARKMMQNLLPSNL